MRIRPRSPYEGLSKTPEGAPHSMAYATLLYGNDETEFSKRLHVVPRGGVSQNEVGSYRAESA
jgi:hypothetical protein